MMCRNIVYTTVPNLKLLDKTLPQIVFFYNQYQNKKLHQTFAIFNKTII